MLGRLPRNGVAFASGVSDASGGADVAVPQPTSAIAIAASVTVARALAGTKHWPCAAVLSATALSDAA